MRWIYVWITTIGILLLVYLAFVKLLGMHPDNSWDGISVGIYGFVAIIAAIFIAVIAANTEKKD